MIHFKFKIYNTTRVSIDIVKPNTQYPNVISYSFYFRLFQLI